MFRTSGETEAVTYTITDNAEERQARLNTEVYIYNADTEERDAVSLENGSEM